MQQESRIVGITEGYVMHEVYSNQDHLVRNALKNGFFQYKNIEIPEKQENKEVCEWWAISSWLCDKLKKAEAITLDNEYGKWWGRTATGSMLKYDSDLIEVAEAIHGIEEETEA